MDVAITGDMLDSSKPDWPAAQAGMFSAWVRQQDFRIFLCSGNHDGDPASEHFGEWIQNLRDGVRIFCDGDTFDTEYGRVHCTSWLTSFLAPNSESPLRNTDILLFHESPAGVDTARNGRGLDHGSLDLNCFLSDPGTVPQVVLCGHVHDPQRGTSVVNKTLIVNPGAAFERGLPHAMILRQGNSYKATLFGR